MAHSGVEKKWRWPLRLLPSERRAKSKVLNVRRHFGCTLTFSSKQDNGASFLLCFAEQHIYGTGRCRESLLALARTGHASSFILQNPGFVKEKSANVLRCTTYLSSNRTSPKEDAAPRSVSRIRLVSGLPKRMRSTTIAQCCTN